MARVRPEVLAAFKPGLHVHYKGGRYEALFLGEDSTNRAAHGRFESEGMESSQEPTVAYTSKSSEHNGVKFRELWQWAELVEIEPTYPGGPTLRVPRFMHIDDWKAFNHHE